MTLFLCLWGGYLIHPRWSNLNPSIAPCINYSITSSISVSCMLDPATSENPTMTVWSFGRHLEMNHNGPTTFSPKYNGQSIQQAFDKLWIAISVYLNLFVHLKTCPSFIYILKLITNIVCLRSIWSREQNQVGYFLSSTFCLYPIKVEDKSNTNRMWSPLFIIAIKFLQFLINLECFAS